MSVIIENTIYPNFKDTASLKALGVSTAEEYAEKVLLAGELVYLGEEILNFSGFKRNINDLIQEVKN